VRARGILFGGLTLACLGFGFSRLLSEPLTVSALPSSSTTAPEGNAAHRDSKQPPAAVTTFHSDGPQGKASAALTQQAEKSKSDWWLVWLTAALVGVGAAQCFVFSWQGWQLRRTVKTMDNTAIRQLRAYVLVSGGEIKFPKPGAPEAQIVLKNCGKTPARNVRVWIHMGSNSILCASFFRHPL
jgi:hypothetical protein